MSTHPANTEWTRDPAEIDRTLEGQLEAEAAADRVAQVAADPDLAARLAARRAFLQGLAAAGAAWRADAARQMPPGLELRVRATLARGRRVRPAAARWMAAAALLVAAVGASFLFGLGGRNVDAMPPTLMRAAEAARAAGEGPRGCDAPQETSPLAFPPVRDGNLLVYACVERDGETVAKLYRPEELPSVGYAAVAAPGVKPGPTIGRTDLGDQVVFDIAYGRKVHYLAVNASWLAEQRLRTPGRESCRACHNVSRVGQANPHTIVQRSWRLGG